MKPGSVQEYTIPDGPNKGEIVYTRTIWMNPGERQPSLLSLIEVQDALQAAHPGKRVSVQTQVSSFGPAAPAAEVEATA